MKIYTKKGDGGTTSLFGGGQVEKSSLRVEACGSADELNCLLGVILTEDDTSEIKNKLRRIQNELFILGTDLATPLEVRIKIPRIKESYTLRLEKEIDVWEEKLPKLKNFIVPGGSSTGAKLHLARARVRCLERNIVALALSSSLNPNILPYINRLSDWFFVFARRTNFICKVPEELWVGRG